MSFLGLSLTQLQFQVISISMFSMVPLIEDDEMDSNRIRHRLGQIIQTHSTRIEYRNVARPRTEVGHYGGQ